MLKKPLAPAGPLHPRRLKFPKGFLAPIPPAPSLPGFSRDVSATGLSEVGGLVDSQMTETTNCDR